MKYEVLKIAITLEISNIKRNKSVCVRVQGCVCEWTRNVWMRERSSIDVILSKASSMMPFAA